MFPALHDQNLKSLQVYVHPMQDRKKVLETYTFTISYSSEAAGGKRTVSGLEVEAPDGHRFNIGSTVASIVYLFRRIIMIGHGLPQFDGMSVKLSSVLALLTISDQMMKQARRMKHASPCRCSTRMGRRRVISLPASWQILTAPSSSPRLKVGRHVQSISPISSSDLKCKVQSPQPSQGTN